MKKLKFVLAALVFLLIVLVCSQVNAAAPSKITNVYDLANWLDAFGGNVKYEGNTVTLQHDVNATTDLYSLDEFSVRKSENIEKGYLQGRYGAIPAIGIGDSLWK